MRPLSPSPEAPRRRRPPAPAVSQGRSDALCCPAAAGGGAVGTTPLCPCVGGGGEAAKLVGDGWRRSRLSPDSSAQRSSRGRGEGRAHSFARASREPRVGRASCCVIAPAGCGWGTPPRLAWGRRLCQPAPSPTTCLSPRAWPPCLLSAGAGPAGGRRKVALCGRAGAGG